MEELIEKIKSSQSLSQEAEDYLYAISTKKNFTKGEVLIRQGQHVKNIYFVTDGCLRSYCYDKNGKEHTLQFAIKNWWISDYIAIHSDESATLTVECLKESEVVVNDDELSVLSEESQGEALTSLNQLLFEIGVEYCK